MCCRDSQAVRRWPGEPVIPRDLEGSIPSLGAHSSYSPLSPHNLYTPNQSYNSIFNPIALGSIAFSPKPTFPLSFKFISKIFSPFQISEYSIEPLKKF